MNPQLGHSFQTASQGQHLADGDLLRRARATGGGALRLLVGLRGGTRRGSFVGKLGDCHGEMWKNPGKMWENHGKMMEHVGNSWDNHGKMWQTVTS